MHGFHLFQQFHEAGEGLLSGGGVGWILVAWVFTGAHESVARAVVGYGIVECAGGFHGIFCRGNRGAYARVVTGIEAIDGRGNGGDIRRSRAVEDECGAKVLAVGGEGEGLCTAPAESGDCNLAIGGREFLAVIRGSVEIGEHFRWIEGRDGFDAVVLTGDLGGASAVGTVAAEEVWRNDDEALAGEFVAHRLGPVAETEDLVNQDDDGYLALYLGVDDERLDHAVIVLEGDVFAVARRGFETSLGPVLRLRGEGREHGRQETENAKDESAGKLIFHAQQFTATTWLLYEIQPARVTGPRLMLLWAKAVCYDPGRS